MRTRDEIEAELHRLGWRIASGPTQTPAGWKVIGQYGTASVPLLGGTELGVLEELLRYAQRRGGAKR